MKYLEKSFNVLYGGKEYRDGWERIFGEKEEKKETYWVGTGRFGEEFRIPESELLLMLLREDRAFDVWGEEVKFDTVTFKREKEHDD